MPFLAEGMQCRAVVGRGVVGWFVAVFFGFFEFKAHSSCFRRGAARWARGSRPVAPAGPPPAVPRQPRASSAPRPGPLTSPELGS